MDDLFFDPKAASAPTPPSVDGCLTLIDGTIEKWSGEYLTVNSPVRMSKKAQEAAGNDDDKICIGKYAMCDEATALKGVGAAYKAYDHGRGEWPQMKPAQRIECAMKFVEGMRSKREELISILMWEICKNSTDAAKEVDRTIDYIVDTVAELKKMENDTNPLMNVGGVVAQVKRAPLGIGLICGPYNYPLNEFMTLFLPCIIMGNTCVLKTPRTGGLCHIPLLEFYQSCFPKGVVNVVHGSGRTVFTPIMKSGKVQILAFIGTHKAAQSLHACAPVPFTVRLALGLDAKNPGIVTAQADLNVAATECTLGALSYCGQRCTAIKIIYVHKSVADEFVKKLVAKVDALKAGLPWEKGVNITPLPEEGKPKYLEEVIADAESKGAKAINRHAKQSDRTLVQPTVLYPCNSDMRCAKEEQFGPLVPIVPYESNEELEQYMIETHYGQQAAVFSTDSNTLPRLVDFLAHHVTRINLNAQCQRGPDVMPFSGRKVSASGTLSLHDALRTMSIRVAVATKATKENIDIVSAILRDGQSNVLTAELHI
ncbi:hypothetical protein SARC_08489 [Sphaeroforma arctica JP610]|uniref:Succinate-semialdehyde dehydrogenase, mitochondrial n=1 Tax=Sphaeroforma arctica JP610 TaxID=667725 RepID=A0A0L0FQZ5_9EUKA|nr:hypothetical protein SARC_08489 [Sphaeroforma arctica JP610]KNC79104.1 hypothetical protein SARC_08489 [Sphaeroforma arctica JP610]|eukprot:XP_014153006.1 hypothetical protein SARC_08489 [Sphaeroforma arctica JP610]